MLTLVCYVILLAAVVVLFSSFTEGEWMISAWLLIIWIVMFGVWVYTPRGE